MSVACANCGAPGVGPGAVRLDLDVKATPPEHVCVKCKRMPKCRRCSKRRNRLDVSGVCLPCIKQSELSYAALNRRTCTACPARIDVSDTNEHGECPNCSHDRLYREHPITVRCAVNDVDRCRIDHIAVKRDDVAWSRLTYNGVQHVEADETGPAEKLEVRTCSCGSTLARTIEVTS